MLSDNSATVSGTLNGDGSLVLDEPLRLPPGRVQITVRPAVEQSPQVPTGHTMWDTLEKIWADQEARGHVPPTLEEVKDRIAELRDEWDERDEYLERIRRGELPNRQNESSPTGHLLEGLS